MTFLRVVTGVGEVWGALRGVLAGEGAPMVAVPGDAVAARRVMAAARPEVPVEDDECAVVVATSGSSGEPKAVMLSRDALLASAHATHDRLGGPGQWLLAMPPHFIGGLQVLTRSFVAGIEPVVAEGNFTGEAARMTGTRRYTALVPTQLRRLLDTEALQSFDAVLVGGAPCPEELLADARDRGINVLATYGMTETGGGCVYDGEPLDGVQVELEGERILLAGPTLFSGYRLRPDLTAAAFEDGWFRTEDRGRLVDGRLEVLGRLDEVVISGGVNVSLPAVRDRIRSHPRVADAEVLGVPDEEWGSRVVAFVAGSVDRAIIRDWVAGELPRTWAPQDVVTMDELPMLPSGKVDRQRLQQIPLPPRPTK